MPKQDLIKITLVLCLLLTFPGLALADTGSEGFTQEIDGYRVELVFATGQAQTGSNELAVKLHDPHGQPLNGVLVEVSVTRPDPSSHYEVTLDNHDQIEVNSHSEAGAADHHEADSSDHSMPDVVDQADADEDTHGKTIIPEADIAGHSEASSGHSHEAEAGGHHDKAEPGIVQLAAGSTGGQYMGQVDFTDTGKWLVKVNFVVEGEAKEANFVVQAVRNASTWLVISSFFGVNAIVIVAAAIVKRKSVHPKKGAKSC